MLNEPNPTNSKPKNLRKIKQEMDLLSHQKPTAKKDPDMIQKFLLN